MPNKNTSPKNSINNSAWFPKRTVFEGSEGCFAVSTCLRVLNRGHKKTAIETIMTNNANDANQAIIGSSRRKFNNSICRSCLMDNAYF